MALKQTSKSGKKFIKNARNVLTIHKELFWPLIDEAEDTFLGRFKETMVLAKTFDSKLKWSEARRLSKIDRRLKIQELIENLPTETLNAHRRAKNIRKDLSLGVNDVCRSLEKGELTCCLVSGEAKPKMLVVHIIDLAKAKHIPILVFNSLKSQMANSIGFATLAIGFKKQVLSDPHHEMHTLCNEILDLFNKKYNYDSHSYESNEENLTNYSFEADIFSEVAKDEKSNEIEKCEIPEDVYLYRESTEYRVFRPGVCPDANDEPSGAMELGETSSCEEEHQRVNKRARYFEPPTVLRVRANPNKSRKSKKKKKKGWFRMNQF